MHLGFSLLDITSDAKDNWVVSHLPFFNSVKYYGGRKMEKGLLLLRNNWSFQ